jgi:hypothetical protein
LKIFEKNTEDDFDVGRLGLEVVVDSEFDLLGDECNELIDVCESGLTNFPGFCVRFAGIGGGKGIFDNDGCFSVSFDIVKCTDELDDDDDDGSSSREFDATTRSRSFRTSRTVR